MAHPTRKRDAPGWTDDSGELGPICWKCTGSGIKQRVPHHEPVTCPVCHGSGRTARKKLKSSKRSRLTCLKEEPPPKLPQGFVVPGPPRFGSVDIPDLELSQQEEVCSLLGHWRIVQSAKGGHRWSTDDLLTAWVATREVSTTRVKSHLDLGCGLGTVLLMTCWYLFQQDSGEEASVARGVGVEAQAASFGKALQSIKLNGVQDRLQVINQDFRECTKDHPVLASMCPFQLITGTPPYFPVEFDQESGLARAKYGGMPTFEQSAPARYEFRGGFEEYVSTGAPLLDQENGVLVICEGNLAKGDDRESTRALNAAANNNLVLSRSVFVKGRDDKDALFAVHVFRPNKQQEVSYRKDIFVIRHRGGKRSKEYYSMCRDMGVLLFEEDCTS